MAKESDAEPSLLEIRELLREIRDELRATSKRQIEYHENWRNATPNLRVSGRLILVAIVLALGLLAYLSWVVFGLR